MPTMAALTVALMAFTPGNNLLPTNLRITVLDILGTPTNGATVTLYKSKEDYLHSANPVKIGKTNEKGRVLFKKLKPVQYYIDARKGDMDNDGKGVKIAPLQKGKTNNVNTIIE